MRRLIYLALAFIMIASGLAANPHTPQGASTVTSDNVLIIERVQQPYFIKDADGFDYYFHVYDSNATPLYTAAAVTCLGHIYNASSSHMLEAYAKYEGYDLELELGPNITDTEGYYSFIIQCNSTKQYGFVADYFEIGSNKENSVGGNPLTAMILLPLLMGILFMLSAFLLNPEQHGVLRIFLMLASLFTYFGSSWIGVQSVIQYYGFPEIQESSTFMLYMFGVILFVVISYFMIYALYIGFKKAAQDKEEMMLQ